MNQAQTNNRTATLQNTDQVAKKKYIKPRVELIFLDNEISLALESTPAIGPGEEVYNAPAHFNTMPSGLV